MELFSESKSFYEFFIPLKFFTESTQGLTTWLEFRFISLIVDCTKNN